MEYRYLAFNDKRVTSSLRRVESAEIMNTMEKQNCDIDAFKITAHCKFCQNHQDNSEEEKRKIRKEIRSHNRKNYQNLNICP